MKEAARIKIFCRSFDLKLYRLSKGLYESWGYPCVRLTDQTADGYFYTMLQDTDCDIAINVDEDCFITNKEAVMRLVDYVLENGIANSGCPDGGTLGSRHGNPLVTNPFFNVFNLNLIREKFSKKAVKEFRYAEHRQQMEASYPKEMLYEERPYDFNIADMEPYYPFLLWQAYTSKTLYLQDSRHPDGFTTIAYNHLGEEMCRHTWLSRFYSTPTFIVKYWQPTMGTQRQRIDNIIHEAYQITGLPKPVFGWTDTCAFVWNKIIRWVIKIPQRIIGWRVKIKRYWQKRQAGQ